MYLQRLMLLKEDNGVRLLTSCSLDTGYFGMLLRILVENLFVDLNTFCQSCDHLTISDIPDEHEAAGPPRVCLVL